MTNTSSLQLNLPTPITSHHFAGIDFYLKQDQLSHPLLSGNKARKFAWLLEQDKDAFSTITSYGSVQSNALVSLAAICQYKGWQLEFFVSHIPPWLNDVTFGNYWQAIQLGAKVIATHPYHPKEMMNKKQSLPTNCVIPEGGFWPQAKHGVKQLAQEILSWAHSQRIYSLTVALPSGTGTTSFFLQQVLAPYAIDVVTTPCVGNEHTLRKQWQALDAHGPQPIVLNRNRALPFGQLDSEAYQLWQSLHQNTGVEFDLLYDPFMWQALLQHREIKKPLLYIHQGGLIGNQSMIKRYQRLFNRRDNV
ncbi:MULTISPECIES: pyridoxal-phosphate dependent enzyme [unclassified Vibrio]|uniref:Pyridoxal-phosphate dependent enzyme n=1 Tax=Vibrio sp. HB236076 TaxID=3232307 RepID=A0AB39HHN5_9VIBR|nr:pyridoxal-phosphate dependent enzyme [Vibrio sp. HB161653]MDP5254964.1 pyridoxal-phosphate dependent enzyme [Vibrio sp. HB161653]